MERSEDPWFTRPDSQPSGRSADAGNRGAFTFDDAPPSVGPSAAASWSPDGVDTPQPAPARRALVARPASIWIAVVALATAAALCLVTALLGVVAILHLRGRFDDLTSADPSGLVRYHTDDYADGATYGGIILLIILALAFSAGYGLFARGVWRGKQWPRIWGLVLGLVSLFGLFGGPLVATIVVLGLVAVAMLWLPVSRRYCDYSASNSR